jgi:signal transduction histidine kinase
MCTSTANHTELSSRRRASRRAWPCDGACAHRPRTALDQSSVRDTVRLQERARIARELHDGVSQTLYAIALAASRALTILERAPTNEVEPSLHDVLTLANAGQSELRALLTDLQVHLLAPDGLTAGLTNLAASTRRRQSCLDIGLSLAEEPELPATTREELMLIAREALRNVERHSGASHVDIVLIADSNEIVLQITDHGRGFDSTMSRPGHFGLQSMRERAASCGGRLDISSTPGAGTQLCVRVPRAVAD